MQDASAKMVREFGQTRRQRDIHRIRFWRIGFASCRLGNRRAVNNHIGKRLEHAARHGVIESEIERDLPGYAGQGALMFAHHADYIVAATGSGLRER